MVAFSSAVNLSVASPQFDNQGSPWKSIIGVPFYLLAKLVWSRVRGIQNSAFCHKNGSQSPKPSAVSFSILYVRAVFSELSSRLPLSQYKTYTGVISTIKNVHVSLSSYGLEDLHFESRLGQRFFYPPTRPGRLWGPTQPLIPKVPGFIPGVKGFWREVGNYLHLLPRLRISGAIPPLPLNSSCFRQGNLFYFL
jgi:hypothetical protein